MSAPAFEAGIQSDFEACCNTLDALNACDNGQPLRLGAYLSSDLAENEIFELVRDQRLLEQLRAVRMGAA